MTKILTLASEEELVALVTDLDGRWENRRDDLPNGVYTDGLGGRARGLLGARRADLHRRADALPGGVVVTAPFETAMRARIAAAEEDAREAPDPAFARMRSRDAETLRRILRAWDESLTPAGRRAAELGYPTGPFDGGFR